MTESQNIVQGTTTKSQFHGSLNEPLPATPQFRQQHSPSTVFASLQQQQQSINSSSSAQNSIDAWNSQQPDIVGPSDHYGFNNHQQKSNNKSNLNDNSRSAKQTTNINTLPNYETKVCVIVDSRTPVIIKIPISPTRITLADLKHALPAIDQPNYQYQFKSKDDEYGIVLELIDEDDEILPLYRDRVVAWIKTPNGTNDELMSKSKSETGTSNMTCSNTSYDDGSSSLLTTDIESTSYFTETEDDSISCSNYSETTCDTFLSQRRNRYYKNNVKSPVHHNHDRKISSPFRYGCQNDRSRNIDHISASSSPTSSSASDSEATAVHCLTVHLVLTEENFLGLHIQANAINNVDDGIYIQGVREDSVLAKDGRIEPGDKLIQVNEISLEELSNKDAVEVLKNAVEKRGPLKLVVAKFVDSNKNDTTDGIINLEDEIHPIDTAAWVAHAQAITIPSIKDQANSATSSPSFGSNAQDTDCIRPASIGMARLGSGLRLNRLSTDIKEIIQHMKMPEIGLDIKNREWLKIHINDAFLGSDLVSWLERNVYGFNNNREAKKFASRMLKEGYIRDPISKKSFSSKSYYTFVI